MLISEPAPLKEAEAVCTARPIPSVPATIRLRLLPLKLDQSPCRFNTEYPRFRHLVTIADLAADRGAFRRFVVTLVRERRDLLANAAVAEKIPIYHGWNRPPALKPI